MIARLREIAEMPLGPAVERGLVVSAGAVCIGFAVLVGVGLLGPGDAGAPGSKTARPSGAPVTAEARRPVPTGGPASPTGQRSARRPAQDPQDRPGTRAARRAHRQLATHRALQALPWHGDWVSIGLVGVRGGKAVLEVRGATIAEARKGYRRLLRRERDDGRAYRPRFRAFARGFDRDLDRGLTPGSPRSRAIPHDTRDPREAELPRSLRHEQEDH